MTSRINDRVRKKHNTHQIKQNAAFESSYYDARNRPSAALYRARAPFLIKNTLTGICIFGFAAGVYTFTIKAVAQDDFEDVPIPDAPVQPGHAPHTGTATSAGAK